MNKISNCKHRQPAQRIKGGYGLCTKTEPTSVCPHHGNMSEKACLYFSAKRKVRGGKV